MQLTILALALLGFSAACGKGEDKTATDTPPPAPTVPNTVKPSGEAATDTVTTTAGEAPLAGIAPPAGWKLYKTRCYEVMAPPTPPRAQSYGPKPGGAEDVGIQVVGHEFQFANCFGQVMQMTYTGSESFDAVKGLDSAIEDMLGNIAATITSEARDDDNGRSSRQYTVKGSWKGVDIRGLGRGIVTGEKSVLVINSFWKSDDVTCPSLGPHFVNSLVAH